MAKVLSTIQIKIDDFVSRVARRYPTQTAKEEKLMRRYTYLLITAVPLGIVAVIFYLGLYLANGISQVLFAGAYTAALILFNLFLHFLGRAGRFKLLGYLATFSMAMLYGGLAFFFSNATLYLVVGGIALVLLVGLLLIPDDWIYWLSGSSALLLVSIFVADRFEPLARFSIENSPALGIFIPIITAAVSLVVLVEIVRTLLTGNIQTRFLITMAAAAIIPVILISTVTVFLTQRALTQAAEQALLSAATQTATAVDTFITTNLNLINSQAGLGGLSGFLELPAETRANSPERTRAQRLILQLTRLDTNYISSIALLDREGLNVLDTIPSDIGQNEVDRTYFQETMRTGQPYASDLQLGAGPSDLAFFFSAPVRDVSGEIIGVLRVRYNAGVIQQIVYRNDGLIGEGSTPVLLDEYLVRLADAENNNLVLDPVVPLAQTEVEALKDARRLPAFFNATSGTNLPSFAAGLRNYTAQPVFAAEAHSDGESPDLVAVAPLATKPWIVAFTQPQAEFLSPIQVQTRIIIIVTLAIVSVVLLAAVWIARLFSRPIIELTEAAESVMAGNLETAVTVTSQDEVGILASSFNAMTGQIRELVSTLEQRVQERTAALVTSAEVGRRLGTFLEEAELVRAVVQQVQNAFHYYHVHIYLLDREKKNLLMAGGTGEAGQTMLARGHKIAVGKGLVGRAASMKQVHLVPDVQQDPSWLPNPLLPDTQAEIAVPIIYNEEVLGVLDVQQNIVNGLSDNDVDLLQSIATQVAIALRNARLYAETQRQVEKEALLNEINQKILRTTDVNSALQVAIRELGRATNASQVKVRFNSSPTENGNHEPDSHE